MSHRALGQQFVSHTELASMYSGDYDVLMPKHLGEAKQAYDAGEVGYEREQDYDEHGGPGGYVAHLAKDIAKNGMREPITVRNGNVVTDGHHRALAAMKNRMEQIPIRHTR